ncbi:MAG TPA: DUF885 domain-containing protein [Chthoniobacterales bacterium]|nr:DUF885 domain-containing protein [Chthoniobacterales bacterium]
MFKRILKWLFSIVLVSLVIIAVFLINLIWFRPWSLNLFYEKVFAETIFSEPELLSQLGLVEQFGFTSHNGKLSDESPAHQQLQIDRWKKDLQQLHEYPLDRQTPSQKLSTHILEWFLKDQVDGEKWQDYNYPVNQLFGVQNQYPSFMANTHRLTNARDCEYYIMRLDALPTKFDQTLESLRKREQEQIIPPRFVVEEVLKEMTEFVAKPVPENILASAFKEHAAKIDKLNDQQRGDFQKRVESSIATHVYPAYQKLITYFQELLPKTTTDDGVWKLPNGDAFYAYTLRSNTTTDMPPNAVHELGLREVTRIEGEIRVMLDANGFANQPIGASIDKLGKDPRFLYSNDDQGRAEALAEYKRLIDKAVVESKTHLFYIAPKAEIDIRRVEPFKEATAPGAYYQGGSMDGSRPGVFYANLRDMNEVPKWSMPTLSYHEGVPGHHWQISLAQELKGVPQFRRVLPFTAYAEGWALYAEWLAKQAGWYDKDPFGDIGRLRDEMLRAVRLVVDTGIHAKHWTREQAIAYMRDKTGIGEKEVKAEIERYIVNPGQACAYKVGMMKIQELRARAQQELGDKFDQREFHDTVLKNGSLPLEILDEQINDYIQKKKT